MTGRSSRRLVHGLIALILFAAMYALITMPLARASKQPHHPVLQKAAQKHAKNGDDTEMESRPEIQPVGFAPAIRPQQAGGPGRSKLQQPLGATHDYDSVEMVVASMRSENVTWLDNYLVDWKKNIYVVDDPMAKFTVPMNKGREAMVFLTYIIDRYDTLPANVLFHHAGRFQWHNDSPNYDALELLQKLRFSYVKRQGYVNLRCAWVLGCPTEIQPIKDASDQLIDEPITAKRVYKQAFMELFPGEEVPDKVGVACCSQFAVRRETIRRRPKEDYIRYRTWLEQSNLPDHLSGRVLEYAWHIIFGKKAVHCPNAAVCYCELYGMCNLRCTENACEGQYYLPPVATLPEGWPKFGWKGERRDWGGLE